jgi:periplasmic copper chaperone A
LGADGVAVYAPILNSSKTTVRLVDASTPIADKTDSPRLTRRMAPWSSRKLSRSGPASPFALAAWREHIWVSGLHKPLKDGDWFDLTLDFADNGTLPVKVRVETTPGH